MTATEDTKPTPVVVYAAKSTADRHDSIPTQIEDCREMAEENGWEVVAVYSDEGFSAYSGNRGPGLSDAQAHAARVASERGVTAMLCVLRLTTDLLALGGCPDRRGTLTAILTG